MQTISLTCLEKEGTILIYIHYFQIKRKFLYKKKKNNNLRKYVNIHKDITELKI